MSFSFSPETIVLQFEEAIREQMEIISTNEPLVADKIKRIEPLAEERSGLKSAVTTRSSHCHSSIWRNARSLCVNYHTHASTETFDQVRINEINTEIALINAGEGSNGLVIAAESELKRLCEAAKPFKIEAQVRNEQRAAEIEAVSLENTRLAELAQQKESEENKASQKKLAAAGGAAYILLR